MTASDASDSSGPNDEPASGTESRPADDPENRPVKSFKPSVWTPPQRGPVRIGRGVRLAVLLFVAVLFVAGIVVERTVVVTRSVELSSVAEPGTTRIALADDEGKPLSPGCGCLDPTFGAHNWFGMNLPSEGFDLDVVTERPVNAKQWALTALVPKLDPIDWYNTPDRTVLMRVTIERDGQRRRVFSARTGVSVLATAGKVSVEHGSRYPYAALLPAAGGSTEFRSEAGSRPQFGGSMNVRSDAPARGAADTLFKLHPGFGSGNSERRYEKHTELTQRGPMLDLLGPTVTLRLERPKRLQLYAGEQQIKGLRGSDAVVISLTTPFALRLLIHPATRRWTREMGASYANTVQKAADGNAEARRVVKSGPRMIRYVIQDALPAYSVRLKNLAVPAAGAWRRFARVSAAHGAVPPMLRLGKEDPGVSLTYQLPPVDPVAQVGVFGRVTQVDSTVLRGEVSLGSNVTHLARGQHVELESDEGVAAGRYRLTPLVSTGPPTTKANLAGMGRVRVDGSPVTRVPFLKWIIGGLAATLLGMILSGIIEWGFRSGNRPRRSS